MSSGHHTRPPVDLADKNGFVDLALDAVRTGDAVAPAPRMTLVVDNPLPAHDEKPGDRYDEGRDVSLPEFVVLHLGCGRKQRLADLPPITCRDEAGTEIRPPIRLINLDGMPHVGAHLTATLGMDAIPLPANCVNLVIATHVLEHIGVQGELGEWFTFWGDVYRVMKPGACLSFLSPYFTSIWCWGDPTHTRAMSEVVFIYLNQDSYRIPAEQTAIPDYRPPCDFQLARWSLVADTNPDIRQRESRSHIEGVLVARKPFRPYWEDVR